MQRQRQLGGGEAAGHGQIAVDDPGARGGRLLRADERVVTADRDPRRPQDSATLSGAPSNTSTGKR